MSESKFIKYYKRNQTTSGVEIRINGRLLMNNIFKDIWGLEPHPVYNHLLIKLDIQSDDRKKLPTTRTSKNGIREGDGKLDKIYDWLRKKYPKPDKNDNANGDERDEIDLFEDLAEAKRTHLKGSNVSTQQHIFHKINDSARIDLYVEYKGDVIIYEGKKDKTTIKDVYQALMYWHGCNIDGIRPNQCLIISAHHPASVKSLVEFINEIEDLNGDKYNFSCTTWKEEGIKYPR